MFALPKPKRVEKASDQEERTATRQRVLDLTVREGPVRDNRWHVRVTDFEEKQARCADGRLVTLPAGRLSVWAHVDDFAHWGERKSGR